MNFIKYSKIYFIFSGLIVAAAILSLLFFGLRLGIDFTGGSILEADYLSERPAIDAMKNSLSGLNLGDFSLQMTGDRGVIIRLGTIEEEVHQKILAQLKTAGELEEKRFEAIGPVIGKELRSKTGIVVLLSLFAIVAYIAFAFRKVSRPIGSFKYGLASLVLLSHDVLMPLAVFSILGKFYGVQITIPIITAFLTVIGYAINNVVVVYDRLRENIAKEGNSDFSRIANLAISQTLTRQLNTSLTTLFPLLAIFFLGGETLKYFSLTLIVGIAAGTYSSIFLAIPLLAGWLTLTSKNA